MWCKWWVFEVHSGVECPIRVSLKMHHRARYCGGSKCILARPRPLCQVECFCLVDWGVHFGCVILARFESVVIVVYFL